MWYTKDMFGLFSTSKKSSGDNNACTHRDTVHNLTVCHDGTDRARMALRYLEYDLDSAECRVFFDRARRTPHKPVPFEDEHEHEFALTYDPATRRYTLSER